MVEVALIVTEYEQYALMTQNYGKHLHHEQHPSTHYTFQKEVQSLGCSCEEHGNPFLEKGQDLLVLDTKYHSIEGTMIEIEALGANLLAKFGTSLNDY